MFNSPLQGIHVQAHARTTEVILIELSPPRTLVKSPNASPYLSTSHVYSVLSTMFRRTKGKKPARGIARGYDHRRPVAKESFSEVDKNGRRTLLQKQLEYSVPGPSRKRVRTEDTPGSRDEAMEIEDGPRSGGNEDATPEVEPPEPPQPQASQKGKKKDGTENKVREVTLRAVFRF